MRRGERRREDKDNNMVRWGGGERGTRRVKGTAGVAI